MAICPAGHVTQATDYCDVCGVPMTPASASAAPAPAPSSGSPCPNCGTMNAPEALFCENCGYDYTTGTMPRTSQPGSPVATQPPVAPPAQEPRVEPAADPPAGPALPRPEAPPPAFPTAPEIASAALDPIHPAPSVPPWVAEIWIDPDWYATQGATDPLPSPSPPDVVPLWRKQSFLIGRKSVSRNIHPDVDCELDTGTSRRHAQLTTDGLRWWVEDLESANGTFVAPATGPLPAMPIPRGRVEITPDQRIYVGAWTRIVIRRSTDDEQAAFAS